MKTKASSMDRRVGVSTLPAPLPPTGDDLMWRQGDGCNDFSGNYRHTCTTVRTVQLLCINIRQVMLLYYTVLYCTFTITIQTDTNVCNLPHINV